MDALLRGDAVLALPSAPGIALPRNSPPKVVDDLRARGKFTSRPDDDTLAHMILDEYIRFPRETRVERSATASPSC